MTDTRENLLQLAQEKLQRFGYNGFSFGDLSREIGIKTASIHYHFPSKEDLGRALVEQYIDDLTTVLDRLEREFDSEREQLTGYIASFRATLTRDRFCLCGMLRAENRTLPESVQQAVLRYFQISAKWLAGRFQAGAEGGRFKLPAPSDQLALLWLATLEGLLLIPLPGGEQDFDTIAEGLLDQLSEPKPLA